MRPTLPPGRICGAVVLILVMATRLVAQSNTGSVYGTVIDELGSPIPGGTATLTGSAAPRTAAVDALGLFRFPNIAPGKYTLTVTTPNFATSRRENVIVSVGRNTLVDVAMRLASVQESVTVTDAPALLDTRQVETGRTFSGAALTEVPTSRDVWSLIQQIPGVQLDTVDVAGNSSAVIGGPGLTSKGSGNVAYEIDGATITGGGPYGNPFGRQNGGTGMYFDFSTFDDVEATTGGSILEQQNSGVTINVVTKRGTNQLKGSARYLYASANWQSDNTPPEAVAEGLQTNDTRFIREYGAELGGPIIHDRVWLWAAASRQDISLNPGTYIPDDVPFPQTTILEPWSAKLNAQISNANSLALYYQKSNRLEFGVGAATIPIGLQRVGRTTSSRPASTRWRIRTSSRRTSSGRPSPAIRTPPARALRSAASTGTCSGTTSVPQLLEYLDIAEPQKQANLQVSRFFNTGRINHEVKFGFNYRQQTPLRVGSQPGSQNAGADDTWLGPGGNEPGYAVLLRGVRRVFERQYSSFTLGDTFTSGNLTVAAGLRYDLQQAKSLPGEAVRERDVREPLHQLRRGRRAFPGLPGVRGQGAKDWQIQYSNWQPRISATYALGEKKSTLLRASYARFADQIGYLGYWASTTARMTGYYYYWTDLNHDHNVQPNEVLFNEGIRGYYLGIDPASVTADRVPPSYRDLRTPMTTELTAGFDHQFTSDFAVSGTFTYRSPRDLQQHLPTGARFSSYEFSGGRRGPRRPRERDDDQLRRAVLRIRRDPRPEPARHLDTNRPGFTQRYYGVDVSVVKQLSETGRSGAISGGTISGST